MKYFYTIFMISIVIISGCSNTASVNKLNQENEQLKQEHAKLSVKFEELKNEQTVDSKLFQENAEKLNQEVGTLQEENENQKDTITIYREAFELLQKNTNVLVDTFSIFSPEKIQKGSLVAGLTVSNIRNEPANGSTSYFVEFTGEFEVKGSIIQNQTGGSKYSFMVEDNIEKLPHTILSFERNRVFFDIKDDQELEKVLGDKLANLTPFNQIEINGVFKNYHFNYVPETDVSSTAEFVRLTSEN